MFVLSPPTSADLTRRIGLALAVLTSVGDPDEARRVAIAALLTGSTDDAVELS